MYVRILGGIKTQVLLLTVRARFHNVHKLLTIITRIYIPLHAASRI
jgi:hypothetical protein